VDYANQPVKPVAPDLPLYLAITLFVSIWLAIGGAFLMESIRPSATRVAVALLAAALAGVAAHAQAPTPSTSGLPSSITHTSDTTAPARKPPNPQDVPVVWDSPQAASQPGALPPAGVRIAHARSHRPRRLARY